MIKRKKVLLSALCAVLSIGMLSGCEKATVDASNTNKELQPIIIQGAMDVETEKFAANLDNMEEVTISGWDFYKGTINDYPVVVSRTEIGMTNAAVATTLGIENFNPVAIINQGTAGGHDPDLHQFDIVLGKNVVNFGAYKTDFKDKGEGIEPKTWKPMTLGVPVDGEIVEHSSFEGDKTLLEAANSVKDKYKSGKVVEGTIGSADEWNKEIDRILWLNETFGTSAEEMETASSAQVAKAYGVPFLGIRVLSNNEVHKEEYNRNTGENCQEYVMEVVKTYIDNYLKK
ncbi:MAG: 5'-methylthioadenosine/S-adenosylhomocysteine nucleosidase [Peptostreptococcaceae bacterium]